MCLQVILAANNGPTINDITAAELVPLVDAAAKLDPVIAKAWSSKQLVVINSGNDLPVIDLRQVCCGCLQVEKLCAAERALICIVAKASHGPLAVRTEKDVVYNFSPLSMTGVNVTDMSHVCCH